MWYVRFKTAIFRFPKSFFSVYSNGDLYKHTHVYDRLWTAFLGYYPEIRSCICQLSVGRVHVRRAICVCLCFQAELNLFRSPCLNTIVLWLNVLIAYIRFSAVRDAGQQLAGPVYVWFVAA